MYIRIYIAWILVLLSVAGMASEVIPGLSNQEIKWIKSHQTLRFAVDDNYPPFNFRSDKGALTGLNIDIIHLIELKLGVKIELIGDSWLKSITKAMNHEVDGIVNAGALESRKKKLNFTNPITSFPQALICRENEIDVNNFNQIQHLRIGVKPNTTHFELLKQKIPEQQIVEITNLFEAIDMLSSKKIDAVYDDLAPLYYIIAQYQLNNIKIAFTEYNRNIGGISFGLRNDDDMLLQLMNKAVEHITEQELKDIQSKWSNLNENHSKLFYSVFSVLLALILLVAIWNILLKRAVKKQKEALEKEYSERQRAEFALLESEVKFSNIVESIPGAVFQLQASTDNSWVTTFLSAQITDEFGISNDKNSVSWQKFDFIHPDDKPEFLSSLNTSIEHKSYLEVEGRFISPTKGQVWFRALASPAEMGDKFVLNGVFINIDKRKRAEFELERTLSALKEIIRALSSKRNTNFFTDLTLCLNRITHADYLFIGKLNSENTIDTLAISKNNQLIPNFTYSLQYTPCENVLHGNTCVYANKVNELFEKDRLLSEMDISAYIGTPIYDSDKKVSGIIVALYKQKLQEYKFTRSMFELVSANIGREFERVKVKNDLEASKDKFKAVFQTSPVALALHTDGAGLELNEQFIKQFGYTALDIPEVQTWFDLAYPDKSIREEILDIWIKNTKEYKLTNHFEKVEAEVRCKDGTKRNILFDYNYTNDIEITSYIDLTKQKETETEILLEKTFSEQIINSLPGVFFLCMKTSNQYRLIRWNKNYATVVNKTDDELFGRSPSRFITSKQQLLLEQIMSKPELSRSIDIELDFETQDGKVTPYNFHTQHFEASPYNYFLVVGFDITERKKSQLELLNYREQLEIRVQERTEELAVTNEELVSTNEELNTLNEQLESQKLEIEHALKILQDTQSQLINSEKMASLGVLTAGIAHEINNPVNFITSSVMGLQNFILSFNEIHQCYASLTKDNFDTKTEEINQLKEDLDFEFMSNTIVSTVEDITMGASRITNIVKGLKTFTSQNDKIKQPTNIKENIEATLAMLQHELKNKVHVTTSFADLPLIDVFPSKLNQVFMNLIVNGIDSIEDKGIISIRTRLYEEEHICEICIEDNGCGIPEEIHHQLFEPFFTTKIVGKGTGLGLYICYNIIKNEHNGDLILKSKVGEGTRAFVRLPLNKFPNYTI